MPSKYVLDRENRHNQDRRRVKTILRYINSLYAIELLRNCDITHIDLQIAHQYACSQCAGGMSSDILQQIYEQDRMTLQGFLRNKIYCVIQQLLDNPEYESYVPVGVEPATLESLGSALEHHFKAIDTVDRANNDDAITRWVCYKFRHPFGTNEFVPRFNEDFTAFSDLQVADRVITGIFDTYRTRYRDLDTDEFRHDYGPHRKDILDNKVYPCHCVDKAICELIKRLQRRTDASQLWPRCSAWACLLSMMYHLRAPKFIHPDRLEDMYQQYIASDVHVAGALEYSRKFGTVIAEAALDTKVPDLCDKLLHREQNAYHNNSFITATYPNSIVERYLTTKWMLDHYDAKCIEKLFPQ